MDTGMIRAYLDRIGCSWPEELSAGTLREITRAHLEHVPFENLEVIEEGREPSLEEADLFCKVVLNHRGGYCFELNKLFFLLLQGLGFRCYPVAVRVLMGRPEPCPFSHRGTIVEVDGSLWYCDVGFGGLGPKGIISTADPGIQTIVGEHFRFVWEGSSGVIIRTEPDREIRMLAFRNEEWLDVDFKYWSGYFASSPNSPFSTKRICYLCTPGGWISMVNGVHTVFENGVTTVRNLDGEAEIHKVINEQFKLQIPQWTC